jgi:hypothetical protein
MKENKTSIEARRLAKIWHAVKTSGMSYNKTSFHKKGGATGARLWDVLSETEYYDQKHDCHPKLFILDNKRMRANIPAKWDEDDYAKIIDDYVFKKAAELGISILKNRGRIKGVSPRKKEKPVPENLPQTMADIVVDFGSEENTSSLLEDVEIINPQIMEDDVLEYNEITGEFDKLFEQDSITQLMIDLAPLVERAKNLGITLVISNK